MKEGQTYYVIAHAYFHYVGEVVRMVGPKTVELRNVCQVHSCRRNWTEFFKKGFGSDTTYDVMPDGTTVNVINFAPWSHSIPTERK